MLAIAVELTGEDTMKRVVLLPLLLMLAGCVTYEGVDQNGRRSKFGTLRPVPPASPVGVTASLQEL